MASARIIPALAAALLLAACSSWLPRSQTTVKATWGSFEEAKAAIDSVEPHKTTRQDLNAMGLDPFTNPNVNLLNYSDILRRFPLSNSVERLDAGLRECLEAGKSCVGYALDLNHVHKERVGPFVLDILSFRRETHSTGWTFNALVLVVGNDVVYTLWGGKPAISETETSVEPLGPLQNWDGSGMIR